MNSNFPKINTLRGGISFALLASLVSCHSSPDSSSSNIEGVRVTDYIDAVNLGGSTTELSSTGFDIPAVNLQGAALERHISGDGEFERQFTRAPNTEHPEVDGVGPVFNNNSCIECHSRDGRGNYSLEALEAPTNQWTKLGANEAIFLRISVEPESTCTPSPENCYCAPKDVPGFSSQLFHRGVFGVRPEAPTSNTGQADVYVKFDQQEVSYADGEKVALSKPTFQIRNPYDSPNEKPEDSNPAISRLLQADVKTSPRMGMPMFGLGLLEAIPEADILALADPEDTNNDGISGKANYVCDLAKKMAGETEFRSLGRFGWKANTPSVAVQGSGAYRGDMGVTNYFFPDESILGTLQHDTYLDTHPLDDGQNGAEVSEDVVHDVLFYSSTLAVPARRNATNAEVRKGATLFHQANCTACHTPVFTTGIHPGVPGSDGQIAVQIPEVANQKIYPFTDMLLHDMGEGLADNRTDFQATGREWKTRPLWGLGLTQTVNPLAGFLHDSRAKTIEEAVLWHGGEAEESKESFRNMVKTDREALIAFLKSL